MALDYSGAFNGLAFGNGTLIQITAATGVHDLPPVRTTDFPLPAAQGEIAGLDLISGRDVTFELLVLDASGASIEAIKSAFRSYATTGSLPLTLQVPGWGSDVRVLYCRPRRRQIPIDINYQYGYAKASLLLHASDPRWYASSVSQVTATPYTTGTDALDYTLGSGVNLAFDYPLSSGANLAFDYTGIAPSGAVIARNSGSIDTYPTFAFSTTSTMNQWEVTNDTTGESATFLYPLSPGDSLTANMQPGNPDPVRTVGGSNYSTWQTPRVTMRLAPGDNSLRFNVLDGPTAGPACMVTWSSAFE